MAVNVGGRKNQGLTGIVARYGVVASRCSRAASGVVCLAAVTLALVGPVAAAPASAVVQIDDMTWTELRDRIQGGATTVLVPIGGTEQSGPHMLLGKHNVRARVLAARIAQRLGNAVVAPVVAYVPEGSITPPAAHMRFTGTTSIPDAVFEAELEAIARSFRQHGFRDVVFLGDHGGYQSSLGKVAAKLNREWALAQPACQVHALLDYYRSADTGYVNLLTARGFSLAEIGTHAGLADTSLSLAIDASLVRPDMLSRKAGVADGVHGDPRRASAELGQAGVDLIVDTSVAKIQVSTSVTRAHARP